VNYDRIPGAGFANTAVKRSFCIEKLSLGEYLDYGSRHLESQICLITKSGDKPKKAA
jgi:hypothetical protein